MPSHCLLNPAKQPPVKECPCDRCKKQRGYLRTYFKKNRHKYDIRYKAEARTKALQKISGQDKPTCHHCGCDNLRFLEINHLNGGGQKESKLRRGNRFTKDVLIGRRSVEDLEILCRVCNALHYLGLKFGQGSTSRFVVTWN